MNDKPVVTWTPFRPPEPRRRTIARTPIRIDIIPADKPRTRTPKGAQRGSDAGRDDAA
jgi:hypothetical protein